MNQDIIHIGKEATKFANHAQFKTAEYAPMILLNFLKTKVIVIVKNVLMAIIKFLLDLANKKRFANALNAMSNTVLNVMIKEISA